MARFARRSRSERRLLLATAILFGCAHVLVRTRELRATRDTLSAIARTLRVRAYDAAQLEWAIAAVNGALPGHHSCLINAVCCEAIAANSAIDTEFRIGAAREHGRFHFHAWVEHQGRSLTGPHDGEFVPLV